MAILDAYGRPIRPQELTRPQAEPGITSVRQIWHGSAASGLTPQRMAAILRACDQGDLHEFLTLAEEMEERDAHYLSVMGTRKRVISGITPVVVPGGEDARSKQIAEAVQRDIAEHDGFPDLLEDLLDGLGKSFSVVELDWLREGRGWSFTGFVHRDPRHFTFDRATGRELRMLDEAAPVARACRGLDQGDRGARGRIVGPGRMDLGRCHARGRAGLSLPQPRLHFRCCDRRDPRDRLRGPYQHPQP